jgi:hypothetical protein
MAEEEVMKKSLPDLICPNLDILIVSMVFQITTNNFSLRI